MLTTTLPRTDLTVSRLAFGCWGITSDFHWGSRDEDQSLQTIQAAIDAGINYFDTAEVYGNGNSELLLAKAFKGRRDQMVIASKMKPDSMSESGVIEACERSLQRLGTDYIDLYQTHWTDRKVGIEETWNAMIKLRDQGKVRHIGVCNMGVGDLSDTCAIEAPVTDQLPYNLLWRMIEEAILPECQKRDIGVLAYSPIQHGLLADKYKSAAEVPDGRARSRHFTTERELARHGEPGCEAETFAAIDAIRDSCKDLNRSMADVALAWVAARPGITCVIVGASTPEQISDNVATLLDPLPEEAIQKLNEATETLKQALGPNPDMWDGGANSRYK